MSDEPKKYQTEDEKINDLEAIQNKPGGPTLEDMAAIEAISSAEVIEKEPSPTEELEQKEDDTQPVSEPTTPEPTKDEARNWQINDELIKRYDEEYTDEHGRKRPFITHKNPEDFVKSYVHVQKNNYHLKNKRIPQEFEKGKEAARIEYESKLAAMQKELDEIKAKPVEKTVETPVQKPVETPESSNLIQEYNDLMTEISNLPDEDSIEHTEKMKKALVLQSKMIAQKDAEYADTIDKVKKEITNQYDAKFEEFTGGFEKRQEEEKQRIEAMQKKEESNRVMQQVYADIDAFASSDKAPQSLKTDQIYAEMYSEAMQFHDQLAEIYTGKTKHDMSAKEWQNVSELAGSAYLNGLPEIMNKANAAGVLKPRNYDAWVELDKIDAIRTGYIRNPQTQQWEKRFDSITGKQINLGDMTTAYNWLLDNTGLREKQIQAEKKKDTKNLVNAINKRDNGVVQLDDSMMSQDGDGQVLTEEDALAILNNNDITQAISEYHSGNKEPLNKMNAALSRVGSEPVTP